MKRCLCTFSPYRLGRYIPAAPPYRDSTPFGHFLARSSKLSLQELSTHWVFCVQKSAMSLAKRDPFPLLTQKVLRNGSPPTSHRTFAKQFANSSSQNRKHPAGAGCFLFLLRGSESHRQSSGYADRCDFHRACACDMDYAFTGSRCSPSSLYTFNQLYAESLARRCHRTKAEGFTEFDELSLYIPA